MDFYVTTWQLLWTLSLSSSPEICPSTKLRKKIVSALKNIEHAALSMLRWYVMYPLEDLLKHSRQPRNIPWRSKNLLCAKKLLNFASLISRNMIQQEHNFINGKTGIENTFRQIFKKLLYMCFYKYITDIFQATKIKIVQIKSEFRLQIVL